MVKERKNTKSTTKSEKDLHKKDLQQRLEENRIEPQQKNSSITSSSDTSETVDSFFTHFEASAEEEVNIFDLLQRTDTESSEDEQTESDQDQIIPTEQEVDFFQHFGAVPDVDDVSEDISVGPPTIKQHSILDDSEVKRDQGKFVNPLTGLQGDAKRMDSISSKTENAQKVSEKIVASTKETKWSDSSQQLRLTDILDQEKEIKTNFVDETFAAFLGLQNEPQTSKDDEIDWETLVKAEEANAFQKHTLILLNELIDSVVQLSEHISPEEFLQKNLDKRKLIVELANIKTNLDSEKNICAFLNRQAVQYFRRKKAFRCILADNSKAVLQEKQKLIKAKEDLDQALAKEKKFIQVSKELQDDLSQQRKKLKQQAKSCIESFESLVKRHLYRDGYLRANAEIDRALSMMSTHRQEISKVRLSLLLQQHTEAKLSNQVKSMNDLGNGLNMNNFVTFQAENQSLDKKIQERTSDLNKLYQRCHNNIHTLAHFNESQKMLNDTIQVQRTNFVNLSNNQRSLREHLVSLKLQRNRINSEIKKLRIRGGLLDKPDLMRDFDNTVCSVGEKKEMVDYLRQTLISTQNKIDQVIADCQQK